MIRTRGTLANSSRSGSILLKPLAQQTERKLGLALVGILSIPLLTEVIRKYLYPSQVVLALGDACLLALAVFLLLRRPFVAALQVTSWVLLMICWQLLTVLLGHQNMMLGIVGLRAVLVPAAALIVSAYLFRALGTGKAASWMYGMTTLWLAAIGGVAVLQLMLGPAHPINDVPAGLGADERQGIGDYTVGDLGLEALFRPTSILLHTGKFGQVAFVLATYSLFYRHAKGIAGVGAAIRTVGELVILIMSGERAGILAYLEAIP